MADRELSNKLSSGEILQIKVGGTASSNIVPTQATLDAMRADIESPDSIELTPQATLLAHKEGQLQYDEVRHTFVADGADGNRLALGHNMHTHVINNSGAEIPAGKAVRVNGVSGGIVQIELAKADAFNTSIVAGVTSVAIPNLSHGAVITNGEIFYIDTSGLIAGLPVYLSDVTAGELTNTAPDIASQVGGALVIDAATGKFRVQIKNNTVLPTAVGRLLGQSSASYSLSSGIPMIVDNFDREIGIILITDKLNGKIIVQSKGIYCSIFEFSGVLSDEEVNMTVELYDVTHASVLETFEFTSGRGSNPLAVPISKTFNRPVEILADNTELQMRVTSASNETLTINDGSFTVTSIHVR